MNILIIDFNLKEMNDQEFQTLCEQQAPAITAVPGLVSMVWLANRDTNTYGGIFTFENNEALEAYKQSEIYRDVVTHANFANIISRDFGILEGLTEVTRAQVRRAGD